MPSGTGLDRFIFGVKGDCVGSLRRQLGQNFPKDILSRPAIKMGGSSELIYHNWNDTGSNLILSIRQNFPFYNWDPF